MRRRKVLMVTASILSSLTIAGCSQSDEQDPDDFPDSPAESNDPSGSQPETGESRATDGNDTPTETGSSGDGSPAGSGAGGQAWTSGGTMDGVEFSFISRQGECGEGVDDVAVSFDSEAGEVSLDGIIRGNDFCKRARLASVEYAGEDAELTVRVETADRDSCEDDDGVAGQCLVDIQYEATFAFEDAVPSEVTVNHSDRYSEMSTASA